MKEAREMMLRLNDRAHGETQLLGEKSERDDKLELLACAWRLAEIMVAASGNLPLTLASLFFICFFTAAVFDSSAQTMASSSSKRFSVWDKSEDVKITAVK